MSNIKYLANGKKVAVVGSLNANELIVQEVYVSSSGSEIPAGENFIVKSVLDEPMQTWQQKEAEKYQQRLDRIKQEYDKTSGQVEKHKRLAAEKIKALRSIASNAAANQLETFEAFINGDIEYLVLRCYSGVEVVPFAERIEIEERYYEGIKLLSLFGDSQGNLSYRVNQYKDGSGSWSTVNPCSSLKSATEFCQQAYDEAVEKWRHGDAKYPPQNDFAKGVEINPDSDVVEYWLNIQRERREEKIQKLRTELSSLEAES